MRIPTDASPGVQQAFRELNERLDLLLGKNNIDLGGRRIINAGDAKDPQDYVTKRQAVGASGSGADPFVVDTATIRRRLNVLNVLAFRQAGLSSPGPGIVQVTRGDSTTLGDLKAGEVSFTAHARFVSTADGVIEVRSDDGVTFVTIAAATFLLHGAQVYTTSNVTPLRTGDFSSLSTDDVRSILGTLITDLKAAGLLG